MHPSEGDTPSAPRTAAPKTAAHNKPMNILYFLVDMFINTFGITRPTEKARRQAAFFILALLVLVVAIVTAAAFILGSSIK